MRERVDNVLNFQGRDNRDTFATNFLEGPDECVFAFDIAPHTGDKGPNTHQVHGKNIEITVNI